MGAETAPDAGPVPCLVRIPQHPPVLCDLGLRVACAVGRTGRECRGEKEEDEGREEDEGGRREETHDDNKQQGKSRSCILEHS